ncbi:MAG: Oxidoreductase [Candidatus Nomurabacteria bacterium GW2011_GWF2_43_8]|uniref:D-lactate dehydrogenase (cytochrome) n=1 Tax=Candidatus Nomurabacteria bacterium GW2011_GWF2_43_8 TaxID=1618779 RepID=A0A0G1FPJ1_9BACT|nr:MAG: Oxidoreductase [Candidatus Nomurabacteria bacterium GW2011_GWF2_43_8]
MKEEILKFFKGDADDSEETLVKYSHDASLLEVRPKLVLFPCDSEDVKNLVKWVSENKEKYPDLSITARCAGTDMSGGAIGESIILNFTRYMNKLAGGPLPMDDVWPINTKKKKVTSFMNYPLVPSYITAEPGMFYRDFEKITSEKGLILPCFTASKSLNAIGGMFGNNSAGERTLKYGQMENFVLSAKVVLADGNEYLVKPLNRNELEKKMKQGNFEGDIYKNIFDLIKNNKEEIQEAKPKVRKNSSGYYIWNVLGNQIENSFDLNKLLVGSQGTLGIATEITLKLIPDNKHSKLVAIFMKDLEPLGRLVEEILTLKPETLETYDDKTMKLAVRFFPDFLKNKGFFGMIKFIWSFLPEFFMMIMGGFPKLIILAGFAGDDEKSVNDKCIELEESIANFKLKVHITKSEAEADKYLDIRRESFALLRKHVRGMRTAPFIDDIIVRPEFLPKFIPELNNILGKYKLTYTLAGHIGDGNFHVIPLMDFKRKDTAKIILELGEAVYDLVVKYHGSITAEHNDGLIRTPYLRKMYGNEIVRIFEKVKEIFDSKNIFNTGKKIATQNLGGTKEYIASHIAVEHRTVHKV